MSDFGAFEGDVIAKWLTGSGKDRRMELCNDFTYVDQFNTRWTARKDCKIDGASIPPLLWNAILGTPFVGDYRRASVVHDCYCFSTEPSEEVHKMFYHAMRCDGVSKRKALLMYKAVDIFGPDWDAEGKAIKNEIECSQEKIALLDRAVDDVLLENDADTSLEELDEQIDSLFREL